MKWKQSLFSKRLRDPNPIYSGSNVDEYHILNDTEKNHVAMVNKLNDQTYLSAVERSVFIRDNGKEFHIGIESAIGDVLGKDSAHAREVTLFMGKPKIGRPIDFLHSFFATKSPDAKIPDLNEFLERQKGHLEDILSRANAGEAPVMAASAEFELPRTVGSDWDRIASEFEQGSHPGKIAIFSKDGVFSKFMMIDPQEALPPVGAQSRLSTGASSSYAARAAEAYSAAQKKTPPRLMICAAIVAGIAIVATGIILILQKNHSQVKNPHPPMSR